MPIPLDPQLEAMISEHALHAGVDASALLGEIVEAALGSNEALAVIKKRAFDKELKANYEAALRGDVVSEAECLASLEAIERGEGGAALRERFEAGRAAFARGEAVETTPDAFMDSINDELGPSFQDEAQRRAFGQQLQANLDDVRAGNFVPGETLLTKLGLEPLDADDAAEE